MEEYDEVDFWGGESPPARKTSPSRGHGLNEEHEMAIDEESEDGDDSEDDIMREDEDEDDDDEEGEGGPMELELIGHR